MSKFITLGAMGAEQLQKQKCKEFCGTPCIYGTTRVKMTLNGAYGRKMTPLRTNITIY